MGLIALLVVYSYSAFYIFQTVLGLSNESTALKLFTAGLAVLAIGIYWARVFRNRKICRWDIIAFAVVALLLVSAWYTRIHYNYSLPKFDSLMLSFGARGIPAVFIGITIAQCNQIKAMAKWVQPIMLLYTICLFSVVMMNQTGSLADYRLYGIDRQLLSYSAAFAFGMNIYLMTNNISASAGLIGSKKWKHINTLAVIPQIYCVFAGGGRGAFLLTLVLLGYYIYRNRKVNLFTFSKLFLNLLLLFAILSLINLIGSAVPISSGFDRIQTFFIGDNAFNDINRATLYSTAWGSFIQKPIIGHGIGSVAYEVGFSAHNIFLDLLVEGGIVVFMVFIGLLITFFSKLRRLINLDRTNSLVIIIFMSSFIMLLFSGSYLADGGIWFSVAYVLMAAAMNRRASINNPKAETPLR